MKDKKLKTDITSFLSNELVDSSQKQIPMGYEVIDRYELNPPFSYALILYNNEKSDYMYFVDELKLNPEEEKILYSGLTRPIIALRIVVLPLPVGPIIINDIFSCINIQR